MGRARARHGESPRRRTAYAIEFISLVSHRHRARHTGSLPPCGLENFTDTRRLELTTEQRNENCCRRRRHGYGYVRGRLRVDALQLRLDPPQDSVDGGCTCTDPDTAAAPVPAQPAAAESTLENPSPGEWAETLVNEMASATSVDDALSRAARLLQAFGGAVLGARAARVLDHRDRVLAAALRQNGVLKRAVAVQHRRHLEDEEKGRELQGLVAGYREQVRRLEADNYALSLHLRNATHGTGSSLPGSFHPEIF